MLQFQYVDYKAIGAPKVSTDGTKLEQLALCISGVVGNTYAGKFVQSDNLLCEFPLVGMDVVQIRASIITQCQAYVAATYPPIP